MVAQKLKSARPHSARQLRGAQSLEDNSIVHTIWGSRAHLLAYLTAHVRCLPSHRPTVGRNVAKKGLKPFLLLLCEAAGAALFPVCTWPHELQLGQHGCVLGGHVVEATQRDSPVACARVCALFRRGSQHAKAVFSFPEKPHISKNNGGHPC